MKHQHHETEHRSKRLGTGALVGGWIWAWIKPAGCPPTLTCKEES